MNREDEMREVVAAIKRGDAENAILYLQRLYGRGSYMTQVIEVEWRMK